ncbi:MAG TPA: hypothetical protein VJ874_03720 [Candidatus Thermoplasmatota archaeon]|nr:hypothetical protein [Candidatus Thermoplasmatota archaeon]
MPTDAPPAWTATGAATGGSLGNGEEPGEGPAATGDPASGVMDRFEAAVLRKLAQASPA